ncbi:conserved hypothetical protein [Carnobacterium maltaromaticum]|nr:conserved hypothetical protein [Carnobacterium maltaromaticum]CAD5902406.1 conserved hypothetical protein [Carnobacterium maltaromaticum]
MYSSYFYKKNYILIGFLTQVTKMLGNPMNFPIGNQSDKW